MQLYRRVGAPRARKPCTKVGVIARMDEIGLRETEAEKISSF